jgi:hypothetical protein
MDLVDRKAVLEILHNWEAGSIIEREVMALPEVASAPLMELILAKARIRELEEEALQEEKQKIVDAWIRVF